MFYQFMMIDIWKLKEKKKVYYNFRGLNVLEDGVESGKTKMKDYLDDDLFESDNN